MGGQAARADAARSIAETGPAVDADGPEGASAILVRLGAARYAVPMAAVAEVGRVPRITRIPGLPGWLAGAVNWRGRILPVVDLRPLLSAGAGEPSLAGARAARLVVCSADGVAVGVLADGVCGVLPLPAGQAEPPPAGLPAAAAALLEGQLVDEEGPVGLLRVGAVFGLRESLPRARAVGAPR